MLDQVPVFISILFILTVLGTLWWFYKATRSKTFILVAISWCVLQSSLAMSGIYLDTETIPPKMILFGVFPTLIMIILTLVTARGRAFIDSIDLRTLTFLHTIRIPVEIVLALLFHQGLVSIYMTFEGTNFDLLSGVSAPIVGYLAFRSGSLNTKLLLAWNIVCLLLLLNVVVTAVFAIPSPFQKLSIEQPNVAVLYFPFNLLPNVIVPIVLFSHLASIRRLLNS